MVTRNMTMYSERLIFEALKEAKTFDDEQCKTLSFRLLRELRMATKPKERQPKGGIATKIARTREYLIAWMEYHKGKGVHEITLARFNQLMDDLARLSEECKEGETNVPRQQQESH